jgi:hypothetical protein
MKFVTGVLFSKTLSIRREFREIRTSDSQTLVKALIEFVNLPSTFQDQFW